MTEQSQSESNASTGGLGYLALVPAWIVPGLGHFLLGQKARGIVFALTIHGLFALGMLVAGIKAINPPEQAIWTYTQFLTGWPMLAANRIERIKTAELQELYSQYQQQPREEKDDSPEARERRRERGKTFMALHPIFTNHPKIQDIGAVYCGIAGMLNLLVMFDVLLRITGSTREMPGKKTRKHQPETSEAGAGGAS